MQRVEEAIFLELCVGGSETLSSAELFEAGHNILYEGRGCKQADVDVLISHNNATLSEQIFDCGQERGVRKVFCA